MPRLPHPAAADTDLLYQLLDRLQPGHPLEAQTNAAEILAALAQSQVSPLTRNLAEPAFLQLLVERALRQPAAAATAAASGGAEAAAEGSAAEGAAGEDSAATSGAAPPAANGDAGISHSSSTDAGAAEGEGELEESLLQASGNSAMYHAVSLSSWWARCSCSMMLACCPCRKPCLLACM